MKRIGLFIGFLTVLAFLVPAMIAQDAKKDADKTDKKDEKKDPDKKDEKKEPEKKEPEKKKEKFVYGQKFVTKIVSIKPDSNREFTIELQEIDQKKVAAIDQWAFQRQQQLTQRQQQLAQQLLQANAQKDVNARAQALFNYNRDLANYKLDVSKFQVELSKKRATEVFTPKNLEVRGGENAKVRSMLPPVEFDDAGNLKKFTKKELEERKDKSGLPGLYPGDFDLLKSGQYVEIYLVKQAAAKKDVPAKKKGPDDVDPPTTTMQGQEYVLVVILAGGKQ